MSRAPPFSVVFTPAARRRPDKLPLAAAAALFEHLAGPVAENPHTDHKHWAAQDR